MNPARPSIGTALSSAESGKGPRPGNSWIYQKNCYACYEQLGFGQRRMRKLYCKVCRRAVCVNCASPAHVTKDKETLCIQCDSSSVPNSEANSQKQQHIRSEVVGEPREDGSQATVDEVLRSARELLGDLKSKASISSSHSSIKSTSRLAQLHSQLTDYDTELVDVRRQVSYYAERLDHRDSSIEAMASEMQELAVSNQQLTQRLARLEQSLKTGETERSCVSCVLF